MNKSRIITGAAWGCTFALSIVLLTRTRCVAPSADLPPEQVTRPNPSRQQLTLPHTADRWRHHFQRLKPTGSAANSAALDPARSRPSSAGIPEEVQSAWSAARAAGTDPQLWLEAWEEVGRVGLDLDRATALVLETADGDVRSASLDGLLAVLQRRDYAEPSEDLARLPGQAIDWVERLSAFGTYPGAGLLTLATRDLDDPARAFDWLMRQPALPEQKSEAVIDAFRRLVLSNGAQAEARWHEVQALADFPTPELDRLYAELAAASQSSDSAE